MAPANGRSGGRVFKSGNSQAVRIPRELAYDDNGQEVEVELKPRSAPWLRASRCRLSMKPAAMSAASPARPVPSAGATPWTG